MNSVQELYFTDKDVAERWTQVKEDFWGDLEQATLRGVKRLLETSMDVEVQDIIGARRWEHSVSRKGLRNGSYSRTLWTEYGWINGVKIPRLRVGSGSTKIIDRYQRRTEKVNAMVMKMFLAGVSTRRVHEVLAPIYGKGMISASLVSRICKQLDAEVEKYHRRKISDDYVYLMVDGIFLKAKSPIRSRRRCVLVAYGIKADGTRELIDFKLVKKSESQAACECFLTSLRNRGFEGSKLRLIITDGGKGMLNALDFVFPDVPKQRCWAHKLRNVANYIPKKLQKACTAQARDIYDACSKAEGLKAFKKWAAVWRSVSPEAVACLERDLEDLLWFYDCPQGMWVKLRTSNIIERVFREVRRRTRPMSCFTNAKSVERIIFAIFNRQNEIWKDAPLEITQES